MERLEILRKIYNYGETLSSEELNQIVSYINSSIEAINAVIDKNNSINSGHCEIRYKNSAQLPEAPESGSNGTINGWSDTYAFPDTANGEITWMTLCFINGEDIYGNWSTPVCITWGSVQGQAGPKGDSGARGAFKSRVFKRQNSRPSTPTGGTYDNPIPDGWSDGVPSGLAIIWSSTCTFYGNGLSTGWSVPAPESDNTTLDIEFSPNVTQPEAPQGGIPFSNHEAEGWYDPNSENFENAGRMIWRAERKVSNGEYDGEWIITRIYGEKGEPGGVGPSGGHYEFRYNKFKPNDQAVAPTKPGNGSNGTTGGWTTFQETLTEALIREGYAIWMTQCYQNENSVYDVWTDPIRITGANGLDGEDGYDGDNGKGIEFVYTRNNTGVTPAAPPTTQQDDWYGTLYEGTANEITWTDNPLGVLEDMMYEYVSLRLKVDDVWSAYSTPVIWSKWGEKGMDGDGYEYIYKRFSTPITWANASTTSSGATQGGNDNPANWSTSASGYLNKEYIYSGSGWSDDPVGIDETYKYEYVSTREYRLWPNETEKRWGAYSTPTLWSGIPGGKTEYRYAKTKNSPTKPTTGTDGTTSPWSASLVSISEAEFKEGYKAWMTQCFKTDAGTYGTWSDPIRISGANGLDGEDGSDIEFIYTRSTTDSSPATPTSVNTDDYIPSGWTDNPLGVTSSMKYEFVSTREKAKGSSTWGNFSTPVVWAKYGEKGQDGDGYEYIYKHFSSAQTWGANDNNPNNWAANQNREYYGPTNYTWSDNPTGVDSTNKYEYVSVRQRVGGTWEKFSTPVLWSNYAEAGATVEGPQGKLGPMSYLAGIWNASTTYTKSETVNPIVYRDTRDEYYYIKDVGSPTVGVAPETSNSGWLKAENYNMVFTDILFVNQFAKLGSFIINEDWLISRHGIMYDSGGTEHIITSTDTWSTYNLNNAYTEFDAGYPNSSKSGENNFCPYLALNARTGESYLLKVHVKGEINATSGTFKGNIEANKFIAGNKAGLNILVTGDAIKFNFGDETRAWFTTKDLNGTQSSGMYLYIRNPLNQEIITLDFTTLTFKPVNGNDIVHSTLLKTLSINNNIVTMGSTQVFYKDSDPNTLYRNSECTTLFNSGATFYDYDSISGTTLDGNSLADEGCIAYYDGNYIFVNTIFMKSFTVTNGIKSAYSSTILLINDYLYDSGKYLIAIGDLRRTISNPNTNVILGYLNSGTTLNDAGETAYLFENNNSRDIYCVKTSSSIVAVSGTITIFHGGASSNGDYLGWFDETF